LVSDHIEHYRCELDTLPCQVTANVGCSGLLNGTQTIMQYLYTAI